MTIARGRIMLAFVVALAATAQAAQAKFCPTRFEVQGDGNVRWDGVRYKLDESLKPRLVEYRRQHPGCC